MNIPGNLRNSILNRSPLTADTNRNIIKDRLPNEYLPELILRSGEEEVKNILDTHFISTKGLEILLRNPFTSDDFEDFISERQKTIQNAMEDLLIKERLDLIPKLRDMDKDIEKVELSLRSIVL